MLSGLQKKVSQTKCSVCAEQVFDHELSKQMQDELARSRIMSARLKECERFTATTSWLRRRRRTSRKLSQASTRGEESERTSEDSEGFAQIKGIAS